MNEGGIKVSTLGDVIRDMDDEELAEFITSTIDSNETDSEIYRVNVNGQIIVVVDEDDLAERLGEECEDD